MNKLLDKLTLDEKITLLVGDGWWNTQSLNGKVQQITVSDGPSGLRHEVDEKTLVSTAMPTLSTLANSWDKETCKSDGITIADECVEQGVDVLLAPGVNIKRTPVNGRNFEYFSEDPFLAGELAKSFIEGVQSKGVGTSLKHFALNNREDERNYRSNEVDERTMREIYLPAFEKALEAKPYTVMCSYNLINGTYASENSYMLDTVLRKIFKFDGVIVSDWYAVHNRYKALRATLDLEMPYRADGITEVKEAVKNGYITEDDINASVNRILDLIDKCVKAEKKVELTKTERHANAVKIAKEGIVLLKNDGFLPLKDNKAYLVGNTNAVEGGIGSSKVNSDYVIPKLTPLLQGRMSDTDFTMINLVNKGQNRYCFIKSTYVKAYSSDGVILTVDDKDMEGEGYDRASIKLQKEVEEYIIETATVNPNTAVIIYAGSAIDMSAWIDKVKCVIFAGYSGEGVNEALADLMSGKDNFSGKLSETFPIRLEDTPTYNGMINGFVDWYREGLFVGYRHYDKMNKEVLFPFGYGLSYSEFEYSNLRINKLSETDYEILYDVKNVSGVDGKEISEVYVKDVFSSVIRPEKELKGFSKDFIKAGETVTVKIPLNFRSFAYFDVMRKDWHIENGSFEILIGSSSKDIRLKTVIEINLPDDEQSTVFY